MFRRKKLLKAIAIFLLLDTLNFILWPTISYGLTAGPTAPEYSSFEPVDTTDMVNLATGDFTYNVPLMEVPGPEGGYPLSLSYHAGISPELESSWVGLGWVLNAGSINRVVQGYPDDHQDAERVIRDNWEGGETFTASIGVGLPYGGVGFDINYDTYRGLHGSNGYAYIGKTLYEDDNFSIGLAYTVRERENGGVKGGFNLGLNSSVSNFSGSANVGTDFNSVDVSASGNISFSMVGISMNTESSKPSITGPHKAIQQVNSTYGKMQMDGWNLGPVPLEKFKLGLRYVRYWSDETSSVLTKGSLNYVSGTDGEMGDDYSYDSYPLLDPDAEGGIVDNGYAETVSGGTLAAFDNYSVMGQGIGGSMQPYSYNVKTMYRQNIWDVPNENYRLYYQPQQFMTSDKVSFRFNNDLSSYLYYNDPKISYESGDITFENITPVKFEDAWNNSRQYLEGSRHIEWYKNKSITNNSSLPPGFINYPSYRTGLNCAYKDETDTWKISDFDISEQVGGFMITNSYGVTYHYNLPVYAYGEYQYSKYNNGEGDWWHRQKLPHPYAYTWLLTAITGPDFVDRGTLGELDENDWGYWVKFEYGEWTGHYAWRNPNYGVNKDINPEVEIYNQGAKQLYYLDAIKTRSHTALFVKDIKKDGKSSNLNIADGGFDISSPTSECNPFVYPLSTLKLNSIILIENNKLSETLNSCESPLTCLRENGTTDDLTIIFPCNDIGNYEVLQKTFNVVLDDNNALEDIKDNSLRVVNFDYSYQLCPETPNSFNVNYSANPPQIITDNDDGKKLTLNSISYCGKGGVNIIPDTQFDYEVSNDVVEDLTVYSEDLIGRYITLTSAMGSDFQEGDLLKFYSSDKLLYGVVIQKYLQDGDELLQILALGKEFNPTVGEIVTCYRTKNPPFKNKALDIWGYYKSDYKDIPGNHNIAHKVSKVSSESVDAWSLRRITGPLGSTISVSYSSNKYNKPILYNRNLLSIKSLVPDDSDNSILLTFYEDDIDLRKISTDSHRYLNLKLLMGITFHFQQPCLDDGAVRNSGNSFETLEISNEDITVQQVNEKSLKLILSEDKYNQLTDIPPSGVRRYTETPCTYFDGQDHDPWMNFNNPYYLVAGNLLFDGEIERVGGGIRVEGIQNIDEFRNLERSVTYTYNNGTTSFEPYGLEIANFSFKEMSWDKDQIRGEKGVKGFKKLLYNDVSQLLAISNEITPPGVIYNRVAVDGEVNYLGNGTNNDIPGRTEYEFYVFTENTFERESRIPTNYPGIIPPKTVTIRNLSSAVGNLKSKTIFDYLGNPIVKNENIYLHDLATDLKSYKTRLIDDYQGIGLVGQLFYESRHYSPNEDPSALATYRVLAYKEDYPAILKATRTIDYRKDVQSEEEYLSYDLYSGIPVKTLITNWTGQQFISYFIPAYRLPNHQGMGPKVTNAQNKHMLNQEGITVSAKVDDNLDPVGIISASLQTWANQWPYPENPNSSEDNSNAWRKSKNYVARDLVVREVDGTGELWDGVNAATISDPGSMYNLLNIDNYYVGEITLYDHFSHALEAKDMNDNYSATKFDNKFSRVLATAANARYHEIAYSGAEEEVQGGRFGGGVQLGGQIANGFGHTGDYFIISASGQKGFSYSASDLPAKKYLISVWCDRADASLRYSINGDAAQNALQISPRQVESADGNGWYLLEGIIPVNAVSDVEVWCEANGTTLFDDFRFHPYDAAMTSYVYNEWGELAAILDNQNMATFYEYDAMGRLKEVWQESFRYGKKKLSDNVINYARNPE